MIAGFLGAFADANTEEGVPFPSLLLGFLKFDFLCFRVIALFDFDLFEGREFIWGYPYDF